MGKVHFDTMLDIFEHSTTRYRGRPLFGTKASGGWTWTTYGELADSARAVASGLITAGIVPLDRIAIISNNRPEWAMATYGGFLAGATCVPMYEAQREDDWEFIINDCKAKIVFVGDSAIGERLSKIRGSLGSVEQIVTMSGETAAGTLGWHVFTKTHSAPSLAPPRPLPDDLACLIYTSGTTGNPKGVMLTHRNIASNVSSFQDIFPIGETDQSLSFLPWAHAFGQTAELHMLFSVGASMAIAESVDRIIPNLAEVKPTLLISVPRIFNRIYDGLHRRMREEGGIKKFLFDAAIQNEVDRKKLSSQGHFKSSVFVKHKVLDKLVLAKVRDRFGGRLRFAVSGGAAMSNEVAHFIDCLGITVYEGYGLSECSPVVSCNWPGARKIGSVGKPFPGVQVKIRPLDPEYENGEIVVYGPNVMRGYYNQPEETAKVLQEDGGLRTGDMGFLDDDGFLHITGRIKEQYKLENGKYVVPSVLEERLKLSPFISNICVMGDNRPYNVAVIVVDADALSAWARDKNIAFKAPNELLTRTDIEELYHEQLRQFSSTFKMFEKVRKFILTLEDFTVENNMLTPSLKVKSRMVIAKYKERIDSLYKD